MAYLEFFPQTFIELNKEIAKYHPELVERLQKHPQQEFEILFAETCSYCNVVIDGTFDEDGLEKIAAVLLARLVKSRTSMIYGGNAPLEGVIAGKKIELVIYDDVELKPSPPLLPPPTEQ